MHFDSRINPSTKALSEEIKSFKFKPKSQSSQTKQSSIKLSSSVSQAIPTLFQTQASQLKRHIKQIELQIEKLKEEPLIFGKVKKWVTEKEEQLFGDLVLLYSRLDDLNGYFDDKTLAKLPGNQGKLGSINKLALKLIHPAAILYHSDELSKEDRFLNLDQQQVKYDQVSSPGGESVHISYYEKIAAAGRIHFYTEDHIQLDGCLVYADPTNHNLSDKKIMVMTQGNQMSWQAAFDHARTFALAHNVNVLIYNPRGVGKSLDQTTDTQCSVVDCRAAILFALEACRDKETKKIDFRRLGIYGHSLGGGVTAEAIKSLIVDKIIPKGEIGMYINHHSFSSLRDIVWEYHSALGFMGSTFFTLSQFNDLNAAEVLKQYQIADQVIVATGLQDELIKKGSRLATKLEGISTPNKIAFIALSQFGHNQEKSYFMNSAFLKDADLVEMTKYHQTIGTWANSTESQLCLR